MQVLSWSFISHFQKLKSYAHHQGHGHGELTTQGRDRGAFNFLIGFTTVLCAPSIPPHATQPRAASRQVETRVLWVSGSDPISLSPTLSSQGQAHIQTLAAGTSSDFLLFCLYPFTRPDPLASNRRQRGQELAGQPSAPAPRPRDGSFLLAVTCVLMASSVSAVATVAHGRIQGAQ